jgi:hypothetical protein
MAVSQYGSRIADGHTPATSSAFGDIELVNDRYGGKMFYLITFIELSDERMATTKDGPGR